MCGRTVTRWFTQDTIHIGPHYHHIQGKVIYPGFYYFPGRTTVHWRTLKTEVWQKPGDSLRIPFISVHTTTTNKEKQFLWDSITSPAEHILLCSHCTPEDHKNWGVAETRWFTQDTIHIGPHYHHKQGKAISLGFYYFPGRTYIATREPDPENPGNKKIQLNKKYTFKISTMCESF